MRQWPHAPVHFIGDGGTYMVTAGTYRKRKFFTDNRRLDALQETLFDCCIEYHWHLQAWAIFANHYHFVVTGAHEPKPLEDMISKIHTLTAIYVNDRDGVDDRKIWFQYWDKRLTYQRSYLARLKYVHYNPVHHRLVPVANRYPWCSARWFDSQCTPAFRKTVDSFKIDKLRVPDDF